jgi:hypothetical protein
MRIPAVFVLELKEKRQPITNQLFALFVLSCSGEDQGSQIRRILMKFDEMRRNRPGPNSKIGEFCNLNLNFLKNIKKIRKKLDEILRPLVKKLLQISDILLVKI